MAFHRQANLQTFFEKAYLLFHLHLKKHTWVTNLTIVLKDTIIDTHWFSKLGYQVEQPTLLQADFKGLLHISLAQIHLHPLIPWPVFLTPTPTAHLITSVPPFFNQGEVSTKPSPVLSENLYEKETECKVRRLETTRSLWVGEHTQALENTHTHICSLHCTFKIKHNSFFFFFNLEKRGNSAFFHFCMQSCLRDLYPEDSFHMQANTTQVAPHDLNRERQV